MHRVAHLSDIHLIAPISTRSAYPFRSRAVGMGRASDPSLRSRKLARALEAVVASGADHLVISGDLTELGDDAEFELFAEVLADAPLASDRVTLIPGNHDAYTTSDGFARALEGPLAPWAKASAPSGGLRVVDRGPVVFIAVDVTRFQTMVKSGGELTKDMARRIDALLSDEALGSKIVVLVIHHPPFPKRDTAAFRYLDSLRGSEHVTDLMARYPNVYLMHGHHHRVIDRPRLFGAPGVADDGDLPRVRIYDVKDGQLANGGFFNA